MVAHMYLPSRAILFILLLTIIQVGIITPPKFIIRDSGMNNKTQTE